MERSWLRRQSSVLFASILAGTAAYADPVLWIDDANGTLGRVDVASGAVTIVGSMGIAMTDIAFDSTGNLYGISFNSLYRINSSTAAAAFIGNLGTTLNSLVFSSAGTLYAANSSLYTINTSTGLASLIGNGGNSYNSSGDLAFVSGSLYLSSNVPTADTLLRIDPVTGAGQTVGFMGRGSFFGLATSNNVNLYGVSGTGIYSVNTSSGATTLLLNYAGQGLTGANGTSFISEAVPPIPEPSTVVLLVAGLVAVGVATAGHRSKST